MERLHSHGISRGKPARDCFESAKDSAESIVQNYPQNVKKYAGTLLNQQEKKKKRREQFYVGKYPLCYL